MSDPRGGPSNNFWSWTHKMHSKNFPILGIHSTTFHLELRNERFILISFMGFPTILSTLQPFQICIFNRQYSNILKWPSADLEKVLWQICMYHWTIHVKVEFPKFPSDVRSKGGPFKNFRSWTQKCIQKIFQSWESPFHNFSSWTQKWKIYIDILYGFPTILSTLQPFQICIFNRK